MKKNNIICYGATLSGSNVFQLNKPDYCAIVFGNETHGISHDILKLIDQEVSIPSKNKSLVMVVCDIHSEGIRSKNKFLIINEFFIYKLICFINW